MSNGGPTNGEIRWRLDALELRADKSELRLSRVEDEADDLRTVLYRLGELESTVKWLVRTIVGLAGVIAAAAGIVARGA